MEKIDLKKFRHELDLNVRFMDLDALGHVNNARYLNFLEEARIAYSQQVLGVFSDINDLNVVVARIEIDYIKPIFFSDKVKIYTRVSRLGNKSFEFECAICAVNKDGIHIASHAVQTIVAFDPKTQKSTPIPDSIRNKVKEFEHLT